MVDLITPKTLATTKTHQLATPHPEISSSSTRKYHSQAESAAFLGPRRSAWAEFGRGWSFRLQGLRSICWVYAKSCRIAQRPSRPPACTRRAHFRALWDLGVARRRHEIATVNLKTRVCSRCWSVEGFA